jgi:phosphoglycolate phosphatase
MVETMKGTNMKIPVDMMIFDLDGTLITSGQDIANAVNYTLASFGLPVKSHHEIIQWIGDGIQLLISRALGEENSKYCQDAKERFSDYYEKHMLDTTVPYDGIQEVLQLFWDKKKIILTNKRVYYAKRIIDALSLSNHFMEIIGADSTSFKKPDSRVVLPVIHRYAIRKERAVMIGDGVNDLLLARNTGMVSCAFLGGLTEPDQLLALSPDVTYEYPRDLIHLFE